MPNSNHLTIYSDTGLWLAVTGQVITGRGQRQNVLAKLSMLLIDNEAEFKAEFNLPSHTFMNAHTPHTHRHTQVITKVTLMHAFCQFKKFPLDVCTLKEFEYVSTWRMIILAKALNYVFHKKGFGCIVIGSFSPKY